MTREEAIKVLGELLYAFDRDEHGDFFYEHGWEVCEATILAHAALREQPRWIPVEERLPEEDGFYLVWGPTIYTGTRWYDKSNFSRYFWRHDVAHWMPLPEAPKEV